MFIGFEDGGVVFSGESGPLPKHHRTTKRPEMLSLLYHVDVEQLLPCWQNDELHDVLKKASFLVDCIVSVRYSQMSFQTVTGAHIYRSRKADVMVH